MYIQYMANTYWHVLNSPPRFVYQISSGCPLCANIACSLSTVARDVDDSVTPHKSEGSEVRRFMSPKVI